MNFELMIELWRLGRGGHKHAEGMIMVVQWTKQRWGLGNSCEKWSDGFADGEAVADRRVWREEWDEGKMLLYSSQKHIFFPFKVIICWTESKQIIRSVTNGIMKSATEQSLILWKWLSS